MKVLDLCCCAGHAFEGWFASEADYLAQCEKGLLECPMRGNADVSRLPSAPRLNLSKARAPASETAVVPAAAPVPAREAKVSGGETAIHGNSAARFVEAVA